MVSLPVLEVSALSNISVRAETLGVRISFYEYCISTRMMYLLLLHNHIRNKQNIHL